MTKYTQEATQIPGSSDSYQAEQIGECTPETQQLPGFMKRCSLPLEFPPART